MTLLIINLVLGTSLFAIGFYIESKRERRNRHDYNQTLKSKH